ncbi:MFS general substrate transporter [Xylona heveae TC161]|uniref:MFS general substrate transporter n=1 Tax=Xylona heveae (strain CBS 132557 / TC161) TaxID=1328760 RepID=A0A165JDG9_XYLHT|nr:MFS general substrate transporter [Xylona heveae TC161]KZF26094.1 MFS general substrate transporter [Xylona heveae TC161]
MAASQTDITAAVADTRAEKVNTRQEETSSPTPSSNQDGPPKFQPGWRFYLAFGALLIVTLMAALDATSLSVALPIIARKIHGTAIQAFWSGTSFLLTSTVFQPSFASFSHIFGRKPLILVSVALFTVGAIVAAVANNFTVLLVGRCIQGVGGGGIIALTEIVVTDLVPLRERGKWFGFMGMMWAIGSVSGPVVGGALAQKASWRWIFWINLPFAGISFIMIPLFLQLHYRTSSFFQKLKRVDWIGSVVFVASTTSFLIPITWGGIMYPWDHWRTLVPLIIGACGLIFFVFYEEFVAAEPVIPMDIFKNRTAALTYFGAFIHGMVLWCILYYLPLYYEAVKGMSPILAGVAAFPETFTVAPASIAVGIAVSITGRYLELVWAGWILTTLGMGLLYLMDVHTSTVAWIFLNLVPGLGTGILFPGMTFSIQSQSSDEKLAFAVAMFTFFRTFGQALGVAVGGVIFQNQIKHKLEQYPSLAPQAGELSKDASGLVQIIKSMADSVPEKALLIKSYTDSLKIVWISMCAFSAVAMIACFFLKAYSLDRAHETEQGFRHERELGDEEKVEE